jgi:hypothetical protein
MCVLTLRIIFACLSKAWFDPEREFQERLTYLQLLWRACCVYMSQSTRGQLATEVVSGRLQLSEMGGVC